MDDIEFIDRKTALEEFKEFLAGERKNWRRSGKGSPLLIIEGEMGIGKKPFLEEMAKLAHNQGHYIFPREIADDANFDHQVRGLIAMLKKGSRFDWGTKDEWFRLGIELLSLLHGGVANLIRLRNEIRKEHEMVNNQGDYLGQKMHSELMDLNGKIKGDEKIVILLYPTTETQDRLLSILEHIQKSGVPKKVRFVVAQKPTDKLITTADLRREHEALREMCANPMALGMMTDEENLQYIEVYDKRNKLNEATRKIFLEKYGGWQYLMYLALEKLQDEEGEITEEIIRKLPEDIHGFWEERYLQINDDNALNLVETVSLLPHAYKKDDVELFADLKPAEMRSVYRSIDKIPISSILEKTHYDDPFSGKKWEDCPYPKHPTAKEYISDDLKNKHKSQYLERLNNITAHYINKTGGDYENTTDRDALWYLFPNVVKAESWNTAEELLTNLEYLKRMQKAEEQYHFQNDFVNLMKNEAILDDKLFGILREVLNTIKTQLPTTIEKADWLDTFAYWINELRIKDDSERSKGLKEVANEFDESCGIVSIELADAYLDAYLKEGEEDSEDWALRFAELNTWVNERAGNYKGCVEACKKAEKMCLHEGIKKGYRYLGQAEFIRLRSHALTLAGKAYEDKVSEAYEELNKVFNSQGGESQWPAIGEWKKLEEYLVKKTNKLLTPPSQAGSRRYGAFKAKVVSNQADSISAIHIIRFFEEKGGQVEWIHHENFELNQFASEDTLFTVLIGGPKSPGISKVAFEFLKEDKDNFLDMYSGLTIGAKCLEITKGKTHCYMLGGISKVNTLMAAYEFTTEGPALKIIERL